METRETKRQAVKELYKEQLMYLKKIKAIAKLPVPKLPATSVRRAWKAVACAIQIRSLEISKQIIIATPIYDNNLKSGCYIAGESESELIINKKGKVIFPQNGKDGYNEYIERALNAIDLKPKQK